MRTHTHARAHAHTHTHTHTHTQAHTHTHTHTHTHKHTHTHTHTHTRTHTHTHTNISPSTHRETQVDHFHNFHSTMSDALHKMRDKFDDHCTKMSGRECVCVCVCECVCLCTCVCMFASVFVYMYIHTVGGKSLVTFAFVKTNTKFCSVPFRFSLSLRSALLQFYCVNCERIPRTY